MFSLTTLLSQIQAHQLVMISNNDVHKSRAFVLVSNSFLLVFDISGGKIIDFFWREESEQNCCCLCSPCFLVKTTPNPYDCYVSWFRKMKLEYKWREKYDFNVLDWFLITFSSFPPNHSPCYVRFDVILMDEDEEIMSLSLATTWILWLHKINGEWFRVEKETVNQCELLWRSSHFNQRYRYSWSLTSNHLFAWCSQNMCTVDKKIEYNIEVSWLKFSY